jgi:hypothetical protein
MAVIELLPKPLEKLATEHCACPLLTEIEPPKQLIWPFVAFGLLSETSSWLSEPSLPYVRG